MLVCLTTARNDIEDKWKLTKAKEFHDFFAQRGWFVDDVSWLFIFFAYDGICTCMMYIKFLL